MAGAILGNVAASHSVAGAIFGDVAVSLFVLSAIFGDVAVSLCVAGAIFGDVAVSLFVAGAVFGEIWVDSRSAKCCIFQYAKCVSEATGGCEMTSLGSDHVRIVIYNAGPIRA